MKSIRLNSYPFFFLPSDCIPFEIDKDGACNRMAGDKGYFNYIGLLISTRDVIDIGVEYKQTYWRKVSDLIMEHNMK